MTRLTDYQRIMQEELNKQYEVNMTITDIWMPSKFECLVITNNPNFKYMHGELGAFMGDEKEWLFDEFHAETFEGKTEFHKAFGY